MGFEFRTAQRETTSLLIGLAGASGSGKTYSAIMLGVAVAYPHMTPEQIVQTVKDEGRNRVVVIDTEGGRALHYAAKAGQDPDFRSNFPFDHGEITAPFTPQVYQDAVTAAESAGYQVIIIDSMSHEYEGEGGLLEWADKLESGIPKDGIESPRTYGQGWQDDWKVKPIKAPGQWKEPKRKHKIMVGRMLQCRAHLIFCMRAEEKMLLVQEDTGGRYKKTKVIPASDRPVNERWEPICEKRFMYEMTVSCVLLPSEPGVPIWLKMQDQFRQFFPDGQQLGVNAGWGLSDWATANESAAQGAGAPKTEETRSEGLKSAPETPAENGDDAPANVVEWVDDYISKVEALTELDAMTTLQEGSTKRRDSIKEKYPAQHQRIIDAHTEKFQQLNAD